MSNRRTGLFTTGTILYEIMTKTLVDKHVLMNVITESESNGYHQVGKLVKAGYIEERTITIKSEKYGKKKGDKIKKYDYLCITQKGYAYFSDTYGHLIPWWGHDDDIGNIKLRSSVLKGDERIRNYLSTTTVAMMADMIGAQENITVTPIPNDKENKEQRLTDDAFDVDSNKAANGNNSKSKILLNDLLASRLQTYIETKEKNTKGENQDNTIAYYDISQIRRVIKEYEDKVSGASNDSIDAMFARFSGIILSNVNTFMCYVINLYGEFSWNKFRTGRDFNTYNAFMRINGFSANRDNKSLICFFPSSGAFKNFFSFSFEDNGTAKHLEGTDRMLIVPISREGVYALHYLMTTPAEEDLSHIVTSLVNSGEYYENGDPQVTAPRFPLVNDDGRFVVVLPFLNLPELQIIYSVMIRSTGSQFTVLCRRWMIPYLEAIFNADDSLVSGRVEVAEIYNMFDDSVNEPPANALPHIETAVEKLIKGKIKRPGKALPDPSSFPLPTCPSTCPFIAQHHSEHNQKKA